MELRFYAIPVNKTVDICISYDPMLMFHTHASTGAHPYAHTEETSRSARINVTFMSHLHIRSHVGTFTF